MKSKIALLCILGAASVNALACYTVYDRSNNVVYNAQTPPVDMRLHVGDTVPRAFPGGHMVFDAAATNCPAVQSANLAESAPRRQAGASASPLLTDRAVVAALQVPHRTLGNVAVVPASIAKDVQFSTMSVVASDTRSSAPAPAFASARPMLSTQVMGAGPAYAPMPTVDSPASPPAKISYHGKTIIQR
ncbi:hypothetical protein [Ramlibacter sp.]|uniref:hypothetical protein n=1 Tax=Ramlibacter sp. TaxID=1917967 RepID=UPI003D0EAD22